tara:strand:+ start:380 stop:733 length:354 start_codon:yes stop_codon:yes gene_type:complete
MSVQTNTYLMIGIKLPYDAKFSDDDEEDKFEDYYDSAFGGIKHHNGLCMLLDGMSGDYVIIGKVLKKTESHRGFELGPISLDEIDVDGSERKHVSSLIKAQFDIDKPATILIVSHYR